MNKVRELQKIARGIERCSVCKTGKSGKAVPGEGNPDADVVFIGEAPGRTEAKEGRPFVGRSGQFLRSLIKEIGLKEDEIFISKLEKSPFKRSFQSFFITSPVKYLPAGRQGLPGRTPSILDIAHGMTHLRKQLDVIDPKIIVLLGSVAAQAVLGEKIAVLKLHGTIIDPSASSGQVHRKYFVTLHPSAAIRFPKFRKLIEKDFQKLKTLV